MEPDVVTDVVRSLYAVSPEEFVAARDEKVKALRAEGAREEAAEVAKLRRPTVSAWLVNLLVNDAPELSTQLSELAEQLRDAQDQLAGDELRALGRHRHQLVSGLVSRARQLARAAGRSVGAEALGEVESTLRAALSDPAVAADVLSGQLQHTVSVEGFGTSSTTPASGRIASMKPAQSVPPSTRASDADGPARSPAEQVADERRRAVEQRKAEAELQEALTALEAAESERVTLEQEAGKAREVLAAAEQRVDWLRAQLQQAEDELEQAEEAAEEADEALASATEAVAGTREQVNALQARADLL